MCIHACCEGIARSLRKANKRHQAQHLMFVQLIDSARADSVKGVQPPYDQSWSDDMDFDMSVTNIDHPRLCVGDYNDIAVSHADPRLLKMWWDEYMEQVTLHSRPSSTTCKALVWQEVRAALLKSHPDKGAMDSTAIAQAILDLRQYRESAALRG